MTSMIVHRHGDGYYLLKHYIYYFLDSYLGDYNHTIELFARLLCNLEGPLVSSTWNLFEGVGGFPLFKAILHSKRHAWKHWKIRQTIPYMLCPFRPFYMCNWVIIGRTKMLVARRFFKKIYVFDLLVGHRHDDIDASFKNWSLDLCKKDYPTILLLIKSYMHIQKVVTFPDMIKELPV